MLPLLLTFSFIDAPPLMVGQPTPVVNAFFADGSPYDSADVKGKFVLMTWWSADDEATRKHFAAMRKLRKEFLGEKRLQMISIKLGGRWDDWLTFQDRQPPFDPNYPGRQFVSDFKWWQAFENPAQEAAPNPFGVGRAPAAFLIGPDGNLLALNIPDAKARDMLKRALAK